MLLNYLKLAWRVLFRRKFFTFISLFGISFTLMALMLFTSAYQTELGSKAPFTRQDDMIVIDHIELRKEYFDTIPVLDSNLVAGVMTYDTISFKHESIGSSRSTNNLSRSILEEYYRSVSEVENMTIYSNGAQYDVFKDNFKINIKANYCDANFWEVLDFKFIEGGPFTQNDFDQEAQRVVVSEKLAMKYFGRKDRIVGEEINMDAKNFEVVGVIESPLMSYRAVQQDIYLPYTLSAIKSNETFYNGSFHGLLVAKDGREKLIKAVNHLTDIIPKDRHEDFNEVYVFPGGIDEKYAQDIFYKENPADSYNIMRLIILGLLSLFILLPTLNLINLNVSRILDRSSEIGVRKAFGAHQGNIIFQFIFENIVLTILGGVLGFILALVIMKFVNDAHLLGEATLAIDFKFALFAVLITIAFGVLSGFLPAYRMSKTQIVTALKQNQL